MAQGVHSQEPYRATPQDHPDDTGLGRLLDPNFPFFLCLLIPLLFQFEFRLALEKINEEIFESRLVKAEPRDFRILINFLINFVFLVNTLSLKNRKGRIIEFAVFAQISCLSMKEPRKGKQNKNSEEFASSSVSTSRRFYYNSE